MSTSTINFTKEEIREFLREEGFDIEDDEILRNFIKGLKKLIKHEEMKKRRMRLGHNAEETNLDSTDFSRSHNETSETTTSSSGRSKVRVRTPVTPNRSRTRSNLSRIQSNSQSPQRPDPMMNRSGIGRSPAKADIRSSRPTSPATGLRPGESRKVGPMPQRQARDMPDRKESRPQSTSARQRPESRPRSVTSVGKENKRPGTGNRLIMSRVTATTDANGEAVVLESKVDLGPRKRRVGSQIASNVRPQTAPARPLRKQDIEIKENGTRWKPSTATQGQQRTSRSSRSKLAKPSSSCYNKELDKYEECEENPESDELYQILKEIMFPDDDSDDVISDEPKSKKLPRPPPHIAIDPVALYHWYKRGWEGQSIPGEDRHMKLRWNVRAKTIGGYHLCV